MKAYALGSAATFGLVLAIYAQTPARHARNAGSVAHARGHGNAPSHGAPPVTATPPVSVSPAISATPSAANQFADKIKERVDRKFKHKGFAITVDGNDGEEPDSHRHHGDDDIPGKVLPIAIISILAVFGFPSRHCSRHHVQQLGQDAFAASHRADDGGERSAGPAGVTLVPRGGAGNRAPVVPIYAAASCSSRSAWV